MRQLALSLLVATARSDQGPCPNGYEHAFDGYLSCALDPTPCASKVLTGDDVKPVLMDECEAECAGCIGLSLWNNRECWVYREWTGQPRVDEQSVICRRNEPPPPSAQPKPPPPPLAPPPPPPTPRQQVAIHHIKAATFALVEGVPPLLLIASAIGLLIVAVMLLVASCLCMRRCARSSRGRERMEEDFDMEEEFAVDDDDFDDEAFEREFGYDDDEERHGRATSFVSQRVLVEVDGAVVGTIRVRAVGCETVRALRRKVSVAAAHLTAGAGDADMLLEYLDEAAGIAVMVSDDVELQTALRMPTLKATFESGRGGGGGKRAVGGGGGGRRGGGGAARGGRRAGYEAAAADEEHSEEEDEGMSPPRGGGGGCAVQ